jgi:hypothetical protein
VCIETSLLKIKIPRANLTQKQQSIGIPNKGYKKNEVAKIVGINVNTITKISKLAYSNLECKPVYPSFKFIKVTSCKNMITLVC